MGTISSVLEKIIIPTLQQNIDYTYTPPTSYNPYTPTSSYGYSPQSNYVYGEYQPMNYSYSGIMGANDPYTSSYSSTGVESNLYGASQPYTNPYAGMTYSPISGKYSSYSVAPSQFQPYSPPTTMTPSAAPVTPSATPAPVQPYTPPAPMTPPPAPVAPPPAPVQAVPTPTFRPVQRIMDDIDSLRMDIADTGGTPSDEQRLAELYAELEKAKK